ncbi:MAG: RluA family pseudouridine synthase [Pseudomonadota bacterium]|nr:RluA family pseudouridine synthase [Pseudomonadota bacterium]
MSKHPNASSTCTTIRVHPCDEGERLDRFISKASDNLSRSRVKSLIESGQVYRDGKKINEPSCRVKSNEIFIISTPAPSSPVPEPEDIPLAVVYEDKDVIVVDKPAGLVVHPAPGHLNGTLVNALLAHCGNSLSGIGGIRRPGIVHRIDKDTSGLVVVAKNDQSHNSLAKQFEDHSIKRNYSAIVWGIPRPKEGFIDANIGRSGRDRKKMTVLKSGGKQAITRYKVQKRFGHAAALIDCELSTGRTHQIRVHMLSMGHPLLGDPTYGGKLTQARRMTLENDTLMEISRFPRQALHARSLGFVHPRTLELLIFQSRLPHDLDSLIKALATANNH